MTIAYLGNFKFPWCTEVHVALTLEALGHSVKRLQEDELRTEHVTAACEGVDLMLWTRTYGMLQGDGFGMLATLKDRGIKTASFHLDYYIGISRQLAMKQDPFWYTEFVFQPDGDHNQEFRDMGFNSYWSPPAVYAPECNLETRALTHDLIFVGTHRGYHQEWPWREQMLNFLQASYANLELYPQGEAVRGKELNELYQSTKVVVGDSIMADRSRMYTTDRIFETTGRGGFIIYPHIDWLVSIFGSSVPTFKVGDTEGLNKLIDYYLDENNASEREQYRLQAHEITKTAHTYTQRLSAIVDLLSGRIDALPWKLN